MGPQPVDEGLIDDEMPADREGEAGERDRSGLGPETSSQRLGDQAEAITAGAVAERGRPRSAIAVGLVVARPHERQRLLSADVLATLGEIEPRAAVANGVFKVEMDPANGVDDGHEPLEVDADVMVDRHVEEPLCGGDERDAPPYSSAQPRRWYPTTGTSTPMARGTDNASIRPVTGSVTARTIASARPGSPEDPFVAGNSSRPSPRR